jgi:hypothetical protein
MAISISPETFFAEHGGMPMSSSARRWGSTTAATASRDSLRKKEGDTVNLVGLVAERHDPGPLISYHNFLAWVFS